MAKMADAVQVALVRPERKKLNIYDHEFNIKPAEIIERRENYLRVRGQISHHLSLRKDDQVYYVIEIENGVLKPIQADIAHGGLAVFAGPAASIIGAYYGVPISPALAEKLSRELGRIAEGSWEQVVNAIIGEIALAFQQRESTARAPGKVQGAIRDKWMELGAEQGPLGQPLTDETPTPDGVGRFNHFQGGSIYWTPGTGAHDVHGLIRERWAGLGWERGFLGYPLTDETATPDGVGRYNHFQGGSIYWTADTGAHEVHGAIRDKWAELGWERSTLKYPTTDEMPTPDGVGRFNDFQGGSVRWHPDTGAQAS
ncbi:MAG TPA: hypothetical protein VFY87_14405 [Geminicoccaceae bacterium]|nr:hypothetical protein [Geminicoccaceae bacterium]